MVCDPAWSGSATDVSWKTINSAGRLSHRSKPPYNSNADTALQSTDLNKWRSSKQTSQVYKTTAKMFWGRTVSAMLESKALVSVL